MNTILIPLDEVDRMAEVVAALTLKGCCFKVVTDCKDFVITVTGA